MSSKIKCSFCEEMKECEEFQKSKKNIRGYLNKCRKCVSEYNKQRNRTIDGLIKKIYNGQRSNSRSRGHSLPNYSFEEFIQWVKEQNDFLKLYQIWVDSEYDTDLIPSVDRKDDDLGYSLDNIQLMTWGENKAKGSTDRKSGINNKINTKVFQYSKKGIFIKTFESQSIASREVNVSPQLISECCLGREKSAGGFVWKLKKDD